mmetsp:Transcript_65947/g.143970  ORF Transcript_65947/g.143970 Transcript_65947/m.143970 type:complete len:88 (-) Transcript_65947:45-308(-)
MRSQLLFFEAPPQPEAPPMMTDDLEPNDETDRAPIARGATVAVLGTSAAIFLACLVGVAVFYLHRPSRAPPHVGQDEDDAGETSTFL